MATKSGELNETSTKEEIDSYVEQVVKEVKEERSSEPEPKGDARITSEHADNEHKETPAEPGSDTAPKGEDVAEAETGDEDESWLDDDLKAEVAAYGIDEAELADFASREELERALRLFDKSALDAGRKALADSDGQTRNEKGQFTKKEEPKAEPPKEGRYEIALDKNVYDEDLVNELTRLRDHYETRLDALEERFLEADARAEEQHFDRLVDSLGHPDLFGKSGQESSKELQRRQDLFVAAKAHRIGLEQLGRPAELNEALLVRVARMVFADELGKKELKQRTRKISKQSNGRQGGGATRPQDPREDPRDEFDRLYRQLEGRT